MKIGIRKLPGNKKQLWNKYIKGNEDLLTQMLMSSMELPIPDIKTPDLPKLEITEEMIQATIDANGGNISREQAIKAIEASITKKILKTYM